MPWLATRLTRVLFGPWLEINQNSPLDARFRWHNLADERTLHFLVQHSRVPLICLRRGAGDFSAGGSSRQPLFAHRVFYGAPTLTSAESSSNRCCVRVVGSGELVRWKDSD